MTWPKTVFLLLALVSCLTTITQAQNCQADRTALIALHDATNGTEWTITWDLTQPMSTWHGIIVNSTGCVTSIALPNNELEGTLPDEFCQLSALGSINLTNNDLYGELPACLGDLSKITILHLGDNQFSGTIPESIGNMQQLSILSLRSNFLSGELPAALSTLPEVAVLNFKNNQLSGEIPSSFSKLPKLATLNCDNNQLSGAIPAELGQIKTLQILSLINNQLSGAIPAELEDLNELEELSLSNNSLSDSIPSELGNLTNLVELYLDHNELTGNLPEALSQLINLKVLKLNDNSLQGCFPSSYNQFCEIKMDCSNNQGLPLSGNFGAFCNGETGSCDEDRRHCIALSLEGEGDACYSKRRIAITITHGSPLFTVYLEGPITGYATTSSRAFAIQNVPTGTYLITIIDRNGCEESKELTINTECQFDRDDAVSTSRNNPTETILTIADFETTKSELQVSATYPNPFTQSTTLPFALTKASDLNIRILTATGQQVHQLQQTFDAGTHQLTLDANIFSQAGIYIYHIQHGEDLLTGKLIRL